MYTTFALVLAFWFLNTSLVDAGLYVIKPSAGSKCHGGQQCTIAWDEDGTRPLLPAIGICTVGIYTGKQQLVQELAPVDVSNKHSTTFIPNPHAGPNSDTYYIGIISTSYKQLDNTSYMAFSPFFGIDHMLGSFQTPLPSATSTKPLPSSLAHSGSSTTSTSSVLSTITVGTLLSTLNVLSSIQSSSTLSTTRPLSPSITRTTSSTSSTSTSSTLSPSLSTPSSSSTSTLAPTSTTASNGALGLLAIPILSTLTLPLVLFFSL
ncbi:hypothetical protein L208DRAFT_1391265 [Tricholoma matsutake]|nr:hypothetical protein L208DRAFT_1391265 [Tricholoma matsutake 945]